MSRMVNMRICIDQKSRVIVWCCVFLFCPHWLCPAVAVDPIQCTIEPILTRLDSTLLIVPISPRYIWPPFAPLVLIAANYQEFLGKSHIVNVPWVFNTLWYVIKAWIEPRWARNTRYLYHAYVLGRTFFTAFSSIMINLGFPAFLIMIASSPPSLGLFLFVLKKFHVALKVHHLIMMHHCNGAGNDIHNCMHVRTFNSLITFFSFSLQHVA